MKIREWIDTLQEMDPGLDAWCMYESQSAIIVNALPCQAAEPMPKPEDAPDSPEAEQQAHEMRARSLAMLHTQQERLTQMVQTETIDHLPAALMAAHYALMELNLESALQAGELPDPIQVLRDLFEAGNLEDHFYAVREQEGEGWEGPRMLRWGRACQQARQLLKNQ